MANASLNISVVEKRMLRQKEAADYSGLALSHFKQVCTVSPIEMRPGELRWDKRDLDRWIDGLKECAVEPTRDEILRRLE